MLLNDLFLTEGVLPSEASIQRRFEFMSVGDRRFMFDPKTNRFIVGDAMGAGRKKFIHKSHAEEYFDVMGTNDGFDSLLRGWMGGRGRGYPHGVIHFSPDIPHTAPSRMVEAGFKCLKAFHACGATPQTVVRSFMATSPDTWEQPLGSILGLPMNEGLLTELFDKPPSKISFVPVSELLHVTGVTQLTKHACVFDVSGSLYIAYFMQSTSMSPDSYVFGFGLLDGTRLRHDVVNAGANALTVYGNALAALQMLIRKTKPTAIAFTGHDARQKDLYPRLLTKLANRIPGYEVDAKNMIIHKVSKPRKLTP